MRNYIILREKYKTEEEYIKEIIQKKYLLLKKGDVSIKIYDKKTIIFCNFSKENTK